MHTGEVLSKIQLIEELLEKIQEQNIINPKNDQILKLQQYLLDFCHYIMQFTQVNDYDIAIEVIELLVMLDQKFEFNKIFEDDVDFVFLFFYMKAYFAQISWKFNDQSTDLQSIENRFSKIFLNENKFLFRTYHEEYPEIPQYFNNKIIKLILKSKIYAQALLQHTAVLSQISKHQQALQKIELCFDFLRKVFSDLQKTMEAILAVGYKNVRNIQFQSEDSFMQIYRYVRYINSYDYPKKNQSPKKPSKNLTNEKNLLKRVKNEMKEELLPKISYKEIDQIQISSYVKLQQVKEVQMIFRQDKLYEKDLIDLILIFSCCLFSLAAENRFQIHQELNRKSQKKLERLKSISKNNPKVILQNYSDQFQMQNSNSFILSEKFHLASLKMCLFGFSQKLKLFQHLFNSYQKNYNFQIFMIKEENESQFLTSLNQSEYLDLGPIKKKDKSFEDQQDTLVFARNKEESMIELEKVREKKRKFKLDNKKRIKYTKKKTKTKIYQNIAKKIEQFKQKNKNESPDFEKVQKNYLSNKKEKYTQFKSSNMQRNLFAFVFLSLFLTFNCGEDSKIEETFGPEMLKMAKNDQDEQNIDSQNSTPLDHIPDLVQTDNNVHSLQSNVNLDKEVPDVIQDDGRRDESLVSNNKQNQNTDFTDFLSAKENTNNEFGKNFIFEEDMEEKDSDDSLTLQRIYDEIKGYDCNGEYIKAHQAKNYLNSESGFEEPDFCSSKIKDKIFNRIQEVDYSPIMLHNWIDYHIYRPLGYKVAPQFAYPDVFSSFLDLSKKESMIHPEMQIPNNRDFLKMIIKTFETIENASADFVNNKGQISNIIIDLLKRFHIFWNVHRQRHQTEKLHENTLYIIQKIIESYKNTSQAMKGLTLHIMDNIKNAYQRFQRAAQIRDLVHKNGADLIKFQLLRRVKNILEKIHLQKISFDNRVTELAYLIDMLNAFYMVNYKSGIDHERNVQLYKTHIFQKIVTIFNKYNEYLKQYKGKPYYDFKDWVATLLLKMEHRTYVIFTVIGIDAIVNYPIWAPSDRTHASQIARIFFEFKDRMMIIPQQCLNSLNVPLNVCMQGKIGIIITNFYNKYQLFASVSGANLLSFIRQQKDKMLKSISKSGGFGNYENFRNLYYANLFISLRDFMTKYRINEVKELNSLESLIGEFLSSKLEDKTLSNINFQLFNKLDQEFYQDLLSLKAKYNKYVPLRRNYALIREITEDMTKKLNEFRSEHVQQYDINSEIIQKDILDVIHGWENSLLESKPYNETPGSAFIPVPPANSEVVSNFVHEPSIISSKSQPTFFQL